MFIFSKMEFPVALLIFTSAVTASVSSTHTTCYVLSDHSSPRECPGEPCLTIEEYVDKASCFTPGSTFIFLAGEHTLQTAVHLRNISNVTFVGEVSAKIVCKVGAAIKFLCDNVTNLKIRHLAFYSRPYKYQVIILRVVNSNAVLISNVTFRSHQRGSIAIQATKSALTVNNCSFGGFSVGAMHVTNQSSLVISGTIFTENTANCGGAIFVNHSSLTLNGSVMNEFMHSTALLQGGAIFCNHSLITMIGLNVFENNSAEWGTIGLFSGEITNSGNVQFLSNVVKYGGALYLSNSTALLGGEEMIFRNNIASEGGAIYSKEGSDVTINTGYLYCFNNTVSDSGGAIFANTSVLTLGESLGQYHNFSYNKAHKIGGAIFCMLCDITIHGTNNFSNNCAIGDGGSVSINRGNVTLSGNAVFANNHAGHGGGACLFKQTHVLLTGKEIKFIANTAYHGGGIWSNESTLLMLAKKLQFISNAAKRQDYFRGGGAVMISGPAKKKVQLTGKYIGNTGVFGGAIFIKGSGNTIVHNIVIESNSKNALCIARSKVVFGDQVLIANNSGKQWGGIYVLHSIVSFQGNHTVIANNSGEQGGGVYAINSFIIFNGCTIFRYNKALLGGGIISLYSGIVLHGFMQFTHNTARSDGGAIHATGGNVTIAGTVIFSYNSAKKGGAMFYDISATLNLLTNVSFSHNRASEYGGAIYNNDAASLLQCTYQQKDQVEHDLVDKLPYCFMQIAGIKLNYETWLWTFTTSVVSYNDTAQNGGIFLYGGLLDRCKMFLQNTKGRASFVPYEIFQRDDWLRIRTINKMNMTDRITSQTYQLCFCNMDCNCSQVKSVDVQRGQTFGVHLCAMDQVKNSISPPVTARTSPTARLKLNQSTQTLRGNCSLLTYNIYSTEDREEVTLYTEGPCTTGVARAIINVTLSPCPDGFMKHNEFCVCEERLQEYNANCTIDEDVSIVRNAGSKYWVSGLYVNQTYQGLILCNLCPEDYCTKETIHVFLEDPDTQCDLNRSKLLCGSCATNNGTRLSLMLGSYQCEECSNVYLALLLPFAAAGIALVVFLSLLRLTVAAGMINSVILYANVLQSTRNMFLPANTVNVLTIFIAWLNLDLGFKTCFYKGMTAYAQTWLQFVFPVYVWMLVGLIILISRYSITVSNMIGSNPVAVLATLLLMSYTKILKIFINVYTFTRLYYPDNHTVYVWLKDANVPYLQSWHLLLTVVTSLVLSSLFLPYTLLLLFGYKFSDKRTCQCLNRLKPFLDTYYAPYMKHTRYWTGFLLLVRCALYVVFTFNSLRVTLASLILAFALLVAKAWLFGRIYERLCLDIIESSIYLNLIVLSTLTIADICPIELSYSLIGIVFITMLGIISFQFLLHYTGSFFQRLRTAFNNILKYRAQTDHVPPVARGAISTASSVDLRELLLDN